jgi:hypothetical protein
MGERSPREPLRGVSLTGRSARQHASANFNWPSAVCEADVQAAFKAREAASGCVTGGGCRRRRLYGRVLALSQVVLESDYWWAAIDV